MTASGGHVYPHSPRYAAVWYENEWGPPPRFARTPPKRERSREYRRSDLGDPASPIRALFLVREDRRRGIGADTVNSRLRPAVRPPA